MHAPQFFHYEMLACAVNILYFVASVALNLLLCLYFEIYLGYPSG